MELSEAPATMTSSDTNTVSLVRIDFRETARFQAANVQARVADRVEVMMMAADRSRRA